MSPIISTLSNNWTSSGGGGPLVLPGNDDELYYVTTGHVAKVNSTFNGWDWTTTMQTNGSFPATMADVIQSPDGSMWGYTSQGSAIQAVKLSNGTKGSAFTTNGNCRGLCTSRNNYAIIFNGNGMHSLSINNSGNFTLVSSDHTSISTAESIVSPPPYAGSSILNKSNLGATGDTNGAAKLAFVDKNASGGSVVRTVLVNSNGTFSSIQSTSGTNIIGFVSYYPNGDIACLNEYQAGDARLKKFSNGNVSGYGTQGGTWPFPGSVSQRVQHFQPTPNGSFMASFRYDGALDEYNMWESNHHTDSDPYGYDHGDQRTGDTNFQYVNGMVIAGTRMWYCGYEDQQRVWGRPWTAGASSTSTNGINWAPSNINYISNSSMSSGHGEALLTGRPKWAEYDHALNQW